MVILAGKTITADMLIAARAFFTFLPDLTSPEKFHATFIEAFINLEHMVRRYPEIEFLVGRMFADKDPWRLVNIPYDILHN